MDVTRRTPHCDPRLVALRTPAGTTVLANPLPPWAQRMLQA